LISKSFKKRWVWTLDKQIEKNIAHERDHIHGEERNKGERWEGSPLPHPLHHHLHAFFAFASAQK
jgi:hypothetical protein